MKRILLALIIINYSFTNSFAQENKIKSSNFKLFNRTSIGYTFGLNDVFENKKANALHIKTVIGFALPKVGFGIGLETTTFNTVGSGNNSRFNTLAFTGNLHALAKPISDESLNFFVKGGVGYSPRVFNTYDKGLTYEGATGVIITSKKKNRYFFEAKYHYQALNTIATSTGNLEVKSIGLGVGTWF